MDLVSGLLCGHIDQPSKIGVIFQTLSAMFELSCPLLHHAVRRDNSPWCFYHVLADLWGLYAFEMEVVDNYIKVDVVHFLRWS